MIEHLRRNLQAHKLACTILQKRCHDWHRLGTFYGPDTVFAFDRIDCQREAARMYQQMWDRLQAILECKP